MTSYVIFYSYWLSNYNFWYIKYVLVGIFYKQGFIMLKQYYCMFIGTQKAKLAIFINQPTQITYRLMICFPPYSCINDLKYSYYDWSCIWDWYGYIRYFQELTIKESNRCNKWLINPHLVSSPCGCTGEDPQSTNI